MSFIVPILDFATLTAVLFPTEKKSVMTATTLRTSRALKIMTVRITKPITYIRANPNCIDPTKDD